MLKKDWGTSFKNMPTARTADGTSSSGCVDEEHGCRTNQAEEKAHREGSLLFSLVDSYTDASTTRSTKIRRGSGERAYLGFRV
jgi:hypothetical protein